MSPLMSHDHPFNDMYERFAQRIGSFLLDDAQWCSSIVESTDASVSSVRSTLSYAPENVVENKIRAPFRDQRECLCKIHKSRDPSPSMHVLG